MSGVPLVSGELSGRWTSVLRTEGFDVEEVLYEGGMKGGIARKGRVELRVEFLPHTDGTAALFLSGKGWGRRTVLREAHDALLASDPLYQKAPPG